MKFAVGYIRILCRDVRPDIRTRMQTVRNRGQIVNSDKWYEEDTMSDLSNTQFFQVEPGPQISARDILEIVFKALKEKGYNPVNQIVGYVMSGDPTYITSYNGARSLIMKIERDELVEELLKTYIREMAWD